MFRHPVVHFQLTCLAEERAGIADRSGLLHDEMEASVRSGSGVDAAEGGGEKPNIAGDRLSGDSQETTGLIEAEAAGERSKKRFAGSRRLPRQERVTVPSASGAALSTITKASPITTSQVPATRKPSVPEAPIEVKPPVVHSSVLVGIDLVKAFEGKVAVDRVSLTVRSGTFFGIVGPNGAGKTTTLSMITGLLRPSGGQVLIHGVDVWKDPAAAKRQVGVLPDRLRLFDRLTGAQFLFYSGTLRGLKPRVVRDRSSELASAFGFEASMNRMIADYSVGMTKKVALAAAMLHAPRLLVLDEPFESVDPVSAGVITEILQKYVAAGGAVMLSSHSMDLIQRLCDDVVIMVGGRTLAAGTMSQVRGDKSLEERFVQLAGGPSVTESMEWLHSFSD